MPARGSGTVTSPGPGPYTIIESWADRTGAQGCHWGTSDAGARPGRIVARGGGPIPGRVNHLGLRNSAATWGNFKDTDESSFSEPFATIWGTHAHRNITATFQIGRKT